MILAFSSKSLVNKLGKTPGDVDSKRPTFEIAFELENVKASFDKAVSEGASIIEDVKLQPWGQTTAYVQDLNGFLIELCNPIESKALK